MKHLPDTPLGKLLDASLLVAPLLYLFLDTTYAARGWWDGPTGALHVVAAVVYGVAALRLITLATGRLQAVLAVVAVLGIVGNAGVGEDTIHVALGGNDLFREHGGPAALFKTLGFFFPLTFLLTAAAVRRSARRWTTALLVIGAVLFPVAHVGNISWLAIVDAVVMVVALGSLHSQLRLRSDELADGQLERVPQT